jgi:DNA gyrase/topoisomerase IV subunit B
MFLVLGIVVGSNAIHLLNIKREMLNFSRQTDAKLAALREVIQRVKNGEDVDVKRILGTGDAEHEQEWEQVIQELETTDMLWEGRKNREAKRAADRQSVEERPQKLADESTAEPKTTNFEASGEPASGTKSQGPRFMM